MRMVDLATAMAPGLRHKIIGIRPGEKLHEIMITVDDARTTISLPDRYVIEPTFEEHRHGRPIEGQRVPDRFSYTSDGNDEWIDVPTLESMLQAPR
jgi:UDP-N-acetylglucosamine 4,6-dehydratase